MHLVKVDVVGAKTPKTVFATQNGVTARRAAVVRPLAHRHSKLGRYDHVAPARPKRLAEPFFRTPLATIDIGGVEERDAFVQSSLHYQPGLALINTPPEVVASESR